MFASLAVFYFDGMRHSAKFRRQKEEQIKALPSLYKSKMDLPKFTVIADTAGHSFSVTSGKKNQLSIIAGETEFPDLYSVRNDTLYINSIPEGGTVEIFCEDIRAIVSKKGKAIHISDLSLEMLSLKLEKSSVSIRNATIDRLELDMKDDARCDANNIKVKVLKGKLYNSYFETHSSKISYSEMEQTGNREHNIKMY
jgi:hypothetical protein